MYEYAVFCYYWNDRLNYSILYSLGQEIDKTILKIFIFLHFIMQDKISIVSSITFSVTGISVFFLYVCSSYFNLDAEDNCS